MSYLSGKCDLLDHMMGYGGWYDREGNSVKFGQENVTAYYSDIMKDFEAFKKATGGVLHKHVHLDVTDCNQKMIADLEPHFKIIEHKTELMQTACIRPVKSKTTYTYEYYGKEYTIKELNKHGGVYIDDPIYFNTLLDILPYLPHIVSAMYHTDDKTVVWISDDSFAEIEHLNHLKYGYSSSMIQHYRKALADLYFKVCKNYLCYKLDERTCLEAICAPQPADDRWYNIYLNNVVDENHDVEFIWGDNKSHPHWTSPRVLSGNIVQISKEDIENYLDNDIKTGVVKIKYVKMPSGGFPIHLD